MGGEKIWSPGREVCAICHRTAKYYWVYKHTGDSGDTYKTIYNPDTLVCKKHFKKLQKKLRKGDKQGQTKH